MYNILDFRAFVNSTDLEIYEHKVNTSIVNNWKWKRNFE